MKFTMINNEKELLLMLINSFARFCSLCISVLLIFAACTSTDLISTEPEPRAARDKSYYKVIESYSSVESDFSGFENSFQIRSTFNNSRVKKAIVEKLGEYYKWEPSKISTELEKAEQENSSESQFFVSFYTPERRNDNLADTKSIWRVLLEVGAQKFDGKVKKSKTHFAELQALYPFHSRWNTPYTITFPVAARMIENQLVKMTLTGPLGTKTIEIHGLSAAEK